MKEFWKIQMTHVFHCIPKRRLFFFLKKRNEGVDPMKKIKREPILAVDSITNKASCASQTWIVLPTSVSYYYFFFLDLLQPIYYIRGISYVTRWVNFLI